MLDSAAQRGPFTGQEPYSSFQHTGQELVRRRGKEEEEEEERWQEMNVRTFGGNTQQAGGGWNAELLIGQGQ